MNSESITQQIVLPPKGTEEVKLDTFHAPHHKLKPSIESKLDTLLKEYASQFAKGETSIGNAPSHRNGLLIQAPLIPYLRSHTLSL